MENTKDESMNTRQSAQRLLDEGWSIVPIPRGTKAPQIRNWINRTFDADEFDPQDNIGVKCGTDSKNRVDVDLDCMEAVKLAPHMLPPTGRIHGRASKPASHYWFVAEGAKTAQFQRLDGSVILELRSDGAQTVVPPSTHPSGEDVRWDQDGEINKVDAEELRKCAALLASTVLLADHWPERGGRHQAAMAAAGFLANRNLSAEDVSAIIENAAELAGDDEPKDRARAARDTVNKKKAGQFVVGGPTLANQVDPAVVQRLNQWLGAATEDIVDEMNETYFLVRVGSKQMIAHYDDDDEFVLQDAAALRLLFANTKEAVGKGYKTHFDLWLQHPRRRGYDKLVFEPPPLVCNERNHNLWRGFAVEPDGQPHPEKRCARYLDHLRQVVCAGEDSDVAEFLLDVLAAKVQRPGELTEVAIVLRGSQGVGKGTAAEEYGALFGSHFATVDKTGIVVGRFNAALSSKLVLQMDEALWPGNKEFIGALKSLVTNPRLMIERKGIDPVEEPNFLQLFVTTNSDWAWPTELTDRRALILNVSTQRAKDSSYFGAIRAEMQSGGRSAFLSYLQRREITHNLRQVPRTRAFATQVMLSSSEPTVVWWHDKLARGTTWTECEEWCDFISSKDAYEDYCDFCRKRRGVQALSESLFGEAWRRLLPTSAEDTRRSIVDRDLVLASRSRGTATSSVKEKRRGVLVPNLTECRCYLAEQVMKTPDMAWPKTGDGQKDLPLGDDVRITWIADTLGLAQRGARVVAEMVRTPDGPGQCELRVRARVLGEPDGDAGHG